MSNFNTVFNKIAENLKDIKFKNPKDIGADRATTGFSADERDGYDPENLETAATISTDLEEQLRETILKANLYDPSITEDEDVINDAITDLLRRIKR